MLGAQDGEPSLALLSSGGIDEEQRGIAPVRSVQTSFILDAGHAQRMAFV